MQLLLPLPLFSFYPATLVQKLFFSDACFRVSSLNLTLLGLLFVHLHPITKFTCFRTANLAENFSWDLLSCILYNSLCIFFPQFLHNLRTFYFNENSFFESTMALLGLICPLCQKHHHLNLCIGSCLRAWSIWFSPFSMVSYANI